MSNAAAHCTFLEVPAQVFEDLVNVAGPTFDHLAAPEICDRFERWLIGIATIGDREDGDVRFNELLLDLLQVGFAVVIRAIRKQYHGLYPVLSVWCIL